uniref:Uncharacterized protein n=1 Tax=Oryza sativa subsp. japonica TaxID=39947 RepID=Q6Z0J8_ORYSJ|nr:hypothetical protein [Oryza sativa Japonica Group]
MAPSYVAVGSRDYARRGGGRRPRIEVRGGAAVAVGSREKNGRPRERRRVAFLLELVPITPQNDSKIHPLNYA